MTITTATVCVYQHCTFRSEFVVTNRDGDEFMICGLHLEMTLRLMSSGAPLKVEPIASAWPKMAEPDGRPMACLRCGSPTVSYDGVCESCKLRALIREADDKPNLWPLMYEKCAECHLFVEPNYPDIPGIAPYVHLDRGDDADERITSTHDATPSGLRATLATWKVYGPSAMRERFINNESSERDA